MDVLFLTTYSRLGGSSRYLVYNYLDFYEQAGFRCTVSPLLDDRYFDFGLLSRSTGLLDILRHGVYFFSRMVERLRSLASHSRYALVVMEGELLPYFPYVAEGMLWARARRTVALYDDAMHVYYRWHPNPLIRLLCCNKIGCVMRDCSHIVVWNEYLANYARQFNRNVSVVNMAVDLRRYRVKSYRGQHSRRPVVLGWIGTPNSFRYIRTLEDALSQLSALYDVVLHVVSSEPYASPSIKVVNKRWSIETEVDDLLEFDIGIMPLPDNEWTRGKSAAKAVQYMAAGIPAVCSPVGINSQLVLDGESGFLAATTEEWTSRLAALIESPGLRREIGLKGRATVEAEYSLEVVAPRLVSILQQAAIGG